MIGLKLLSANPLAVGSGAGIIGLAKAAEAETVRAARAAMRTRLIFMGILLNSKMKVCCKWPGGVRQTKARVTQKW